MILFLSLVAKMHILSFNVKGLADFKKHQDVFTYIYNKKPDIIFLQETNSKVNEEQLWKIQCSHKNIVFNHAPQDRFMKGWR